MGAELKGLKELDSGIEYIWQSDPAWWGGAAPILFPIIGGLKNGSYTFGGKTYAMPGHGIVRKKAWAICRTSADSATFQTESDGETRELYPFDFNLKVHYELKGKSLSVRYEVANTGNATMYFSIGSHPAFNIPFAGGYMENYYFHFSQAEKLERYFFSKGMHLNETEPVFDNSRQIFLNKRLFDRGPIIFKKPASKAVTIMNSRNPKRIRVSTEGVPYLALWAPPGAPFACIEPWFGVPDNIDTDGEFTTKEGILSLDAKGTFNTTYCIEIEN